MSALSAVPGYDATTSLTEAVLQGVLDADAATSASGLLATALFIVVPALFAGAVLKFVAERTLIPALCSGTDATFALNTYTRGKRLGKGNYGTVYLASRDGEEIVEKETLMNKDPNAAAFAQAELFVNRKLKLCGQGGCCATFLGHVYTGGALSLVFKNEGSTTLDDALTRSFPLNVEGIIGGGQGDEAQRSATVIRKISKQIFSNLAGIHSWSVVHRDVKGENFLLSETDRRFKLIDFGVAVDLATGTNYRADLQPFDPVYCPPEAPPVDRGGAGGIQRSAGGAFDVFSAALLLVQMCFPSTRGRDGMKRFQATLVQCDYDLQAWRESLAGVKDYEPGFELLDKYGGWSVLKGCLRENPSRRISAATVAASGFCRA